MFKPLKITVQRGCVQVNRAWLYFDHPQVKLIEVDLHTKHAEICATSSEPSIILMAGKSSLHLSEKRKGPTTISFPQFAGFHVWSCDISCYTLNITLHKVF